MSELVRIDTSDEQVVHHADWVEIQCLLRADRSMSREELARAIKQPSSMTEDRAREFADQAFSELEDRYKTLSSALNGNAYPYQLDNKLEVLSYRLSSQSDLSARIPYMFLLLTTRHSMASTDRKRKGVDPTKVFEKLCADVLHRFWGDGDQCFVRIIGTSKDSDAKVRFPNSIDDLCKSMCEGGRWKQGARSPGAGDGGVDVVVWRKFRDQRKGNHVGFAQCKTGSHWQDHIGKLRPSAFCGKYMSEPLVLEPRSIFMVPNRILHSTWEDRVREGETLLFDRCRIVEFASTLSQSVMSEAMLWTNAALHSIQATI